MAAVERQGALVVVLGVDVCLGCAAPSHPAEGVQQQRGAQSLAHGVGVHGEALQVGAAARDTRERVSQGWLAGVHAQDAVRRGVEGFAQRALVEAPEVVEGRGVDPEDVVVASPTPATDPDVGSGDGMTQRTAEQRQGAQGREAAGQERVLLGNGEGGGHDPAVALGAQPSDDLRDGGAVEMLVDERRHRCSGGVGAPWPDPDGAAAGDRQIPHRRRSFEATPTGSDATERRQMVGRVAPGCSRRPTLAGVSLLLITHERCLDHVAGREHPERPDRLRAAWAGIEALHLDSDLVRREAQPAAADAVLRVHSSEHVANLESVDRAGGGRLDPDTRMNDKTLEAARLAAGAGLQAIAALDAGEVDTAFCAVRPPGHHATPTQSMGFCFLNNVAVTAAALAERGEKVLILDYDAHHGNGTQDIFYDDPRVLFVSLHQMPLYPGTGHLEERGSGDGVGSTVNVPMPPEATGEHYRRAWDEVIAPVVDAFEPTWLLISAGFDGHRADPLTQLGLTSADLADLTLAALEVVPAGRRVVFLEGGYDLEAIRDSTHSVLGALVGERIHLESPTSGGPGADAVAAAARVHAVD